jgi:hypothetical protein
MLSRHERQAQVDDLHLEGWRKHEIAALLDIPLRIVGNDLRDLRTRLKRQVHGHTALENAHSIRVYKHLQSVLWTAIDKLTDQDDHKAIAPFARNIADSQKAIDNMHERLDRDIDSSEDAVTLRDIVAQFTPQEIEAASRPYRDDPDAQEPDPDALGDGLQPNRTPGRPALNEQAPDGPADIPA